MSFLLRTMALALTAAGLAPVAAQPSFAQPFDTALVARAKTEGRLALYSGFSGNQLHAAIKKGFEETFGISVEMLIARPSEITERVRVEAAAGRVGGDVLLHGEATLRRMVVDGLIQETPGYSGVDDLIVPDSNPRFAAPGFINGYGMMVNSALVKPEDEPKSWLDLLDPKWSGKMLADDTRALGSGQIFFTATFGKIGVDFHRQLARQKIVFGRDLGADQLRVARGEFPLRWPQSLSNMRDLRGLPLRFIIPKEGLPYVRVDSAVIKGAARPGAARLFAQYMLSQKTQDMLAGFGLIPVIKGAVNAPDKETSELVTRAKANLMGTSHPDTMESMLALAKEIYR